MNYRRRLPTRDALWIADALLRKLQGEDCTTPAEDHALWTLIQIVRALPEETR